MRQKTALQLAADSVAAARYARLRHVTDDRPGISRVRHGAAFIYRDARGRKIRDARTLARIRALAIPPAYTDVWISPVANGHLQATGRDDRGRKQYRYHPAWQQVRSATKFHRMVLFGRLLPRMRRTLRRHLRLKGLPREKVLAAVINLLECTRIRIGNDEYAQHNNSFGLTTLKDRHARIRGPRVQLRFRGKSGKEHVLCFEDSRLARIVRRCQELPGQELFQYVDDEGRVRDVTSADVNAYLREISGQDFTAKDFRTWAGTVLFIEALRRVEPCASKRQTRQALTTLVRQVATELGNTPTICRKYYIHPFAIDAFLRGSIHDLMAQAHRPGKRGKALSTEALIMTMLKRLDFDKVVQAATENAPGRGKKASSQANATRALKRPA